MSNPNSPTDSPPNIHPLNYAPRPPGRRSWLWRFTIAALIATTALICLKIGVLAVHQAQVLYWQRQCLNYPNTGQPINLTAPAGLPAAWCNFLNLYGMTTPTSVGHLYCLYLGRMKRPDGVERLVIVWLYPFNAVPLKPNGNIGYDVIQPATITRPAQMRTNTGSRSLVLGDATPTTSPTIHGAILDPADPSHFTITVTLIDGQTSILDGFLDNNDTLHIDQRP